MVQEGFLDVLRAVEHCHGHVIDWASSILGLWKIAALCRETIRSFTAIHFTI